MQTYSPMPSISMLWLTDPWNTLTHFQDTTLRLADEAQKLGIQTYWSATDIIFDSEPDQLKVVPVTTNFVTFSEADLFRNLTSVPSSKFHQIHYRVDPPVDDIYTSFIEKLLAKGVRKEIILNPVYIITQQSEKIPPPDLLHLAPKLQVVKTDSEIGFAFQKFKDEVAYVTKPLNLAQSIGVKQWPKPKTEAEFFKILREQTENGKTAILVEEFLPEISNGEVRMWFACGKFIAALKKHPKKGDFRVLIDEGSKIEAHTLTPNEEALALEVGASLKKSKVALAAIDFISEKICDFNLTSPGLLIQLEEVHQKNFALPIILELVRNLPRD
jgi:glutathione synthase